MPNHSDARNARNKTTLSLSLAILIIIMDMSGLAGLAAQEELEEVQEKRETLSSLNMPGFQSGLASSNQTFDISSDGTSACMVLDDQSLWCWGDGTNYALARGNTGNSATPIPVVRDSSTWTEQTVAVSLGHYHNCELLSSGTVQCWGTLYPAGADGPLVSASFSYQSTTPAPVTLDAAAILVDSGYDHSCAILVNGSVQCWGGNEYGQLGIGYRCDTVNQGDCGAHGQYNRILYPQYVLLPSGRTAVGLNLFNTATCIILDDRSYVCSGNEFGGVSTPMYMNDSRMHIDFADQKSAVDGGDLLNLETYQSDNKLTHTTMKYGGAATPHYHHNITNTYAVLGGIRAIAGATSLTGQVFEVVVRYS